MTSLSNEEKISIINQHIKNVELNKYNLQLSLIEENAVASPDATAVSSLNSQISSIDAKLEALQSEKASLV